MYISNNMHITINNNTSISYTKYIKSMTIKNKLVYLQVIQELMDAIKYNLSFTTQNTSKNPSITCLTLLCLIQNLCFQNP